MIVLDINDDLTLSHRSSARHLAKTIVDVEYADAIAKIEIELYRFEISWTGNAYQDIGLFLNLRKRKEINPSESSFKSIH